RRLRSRPTCNRLDLLGLVREFEHAICSDLNEAGHQSGPTGLMTCANSGAVIAVKVFVEQNQIPPVRILLELIGATVDGPASVLPSENADQALRQFSADPFQV